MADLRTWLERELRRTDTATRLLARKVESSREVKTREVGSPASGEGSAQAGAGVQDEALGAEAEEEALPPLPRTIGDPAAFVRGLELEKFFSDPAFNSGARELTRPEKLRAGCETIIARNRIDILDKEIQMICSDNIERMRAIGAYIEYEKGQRVDPAPPGVVTLGEATAQGGMRVYSFPPEEEEFAGIYEKRDEQREIGERLVRRLLKLAEG